jgi:hypothetical protein
MSCFRLVFQVVPWENSVRYGQKQSKVGRLGKTRYVSQMRGIGKENISSRKIFHKPQKFKNIYI